MLGPWPPDKDVAPEALSDSLVQLMLDGESGRALWWYNQELALTEGQNKVPPSIRRSTPVAGSGMPDARR